MYIVEWQDKNDNRMSVSNQPRYYSKLIPLFIVVVNSQVGWKLLFEVTQTVIYK